jgi:Na+/H+ antiporter NhaD/arsenite permease-like protein
VIAGALRQTGFFRWLGIRAVRLSRGRPLRLLVAMATITALLSAFLDNVTTVVLLTPVILSISRTLGISPAPYLISMILASNIGGTATLIGDPPNILIGSAAGLDFMAFLTNLGPAIVVVFLAFLAVMVVVFRRSLQVPDERREAALEGLEEAMITDRRLLVPALIILALTVIGFLAHGFLGVEVATIALLGATLLLLLGRLDPAETLREVEWVTLFFFIGLFILVEAVVRTGIVGGIAEGIVEATGGELVTTALALLWFSAGASAIIDNIPYTATAIPSVKHVIEAGVPPTALWWALALGACLGGNLTIVGASANVVVANLAERAGHPIHFWQFIRYGAVVTVGSLAISTAYVWWRYLA